MQIMTFFGGSGGDSLTGIQGSFTGAPGSKKRKRALVLIFMLGRWRLKYLPGWAGTEVATQHGNVCTFPVVTDNSYCMLSMVSRKNTVVLQHSWVPQKTSQSCAVSLNKHIKQYLTRLVAHFDVLKPSSSKTALWGRCNFLHSSGK